MLERPVVDTSDDELRTGEYPLRALVQGVAWPSDVDPTCREEYLSDQEFLRVFSMTKVLGGDSVLSLLCSSLIMRVVLSLLCSSLLLRDYTVLYHTVYTPLIFLIPYAGTLVQQEQFRSLPRYVRIRIKKEKNLF